MVIYKLKRTGSKKMTCDYVSQLLTFFLNIEVVPVLSCTQRLIVFFKCAGIPDAVFLHSRIVGIL